MLFYIFPLCISSQDTTVSSSRQLWNMPTMQALAIRSLTSLQLPGTFTFMHLADAFIQSNLQCIQVIHLCCQYVYSLGIEPTTFVLLTQRSNHWATGTNPNPTRARGYPLNINPKPDPKPESISGPAGSGRVADLYSTVIRQQHMIDRTEQERLLLYIHCAKVL